MTPPRVLTAEEVAAIERYRLSDGYEILPGPDDTLDLCATLRDRDAKIAKLRAALGAAHERLWHDELAGQDMAVIRRVLEETKVNCDPLPRMETGVCDTIPCPDPLVIVSGEEVATGKPPKEMK